LRRSYLENSLATAGEKLVVVDVVVDVDVGMVIEADDAKML